MILTKLNDHLTTIYIAIALVMLLAGLYQFFYGEGLKALLELMCSNIMLTLASLEHRE